MPSAPAVLTTCVQVTALTLVAELRPSLCTEPPLWLLLKPVSSVWFFVKKSDLFLCSGHQVFTSSLRIRDHLLKPTLQSLPGIQQRVTVMLLSNSRPLVSSPDCLVLGVAVIFTVSQKR